MSALDRLVWYVTDRFVARSILLYQRLTRVISQFTDGVEAELQKRMDDLDNRARQSVEALAQLSPHIDRLNEGLGRVEKYLFKDLDSALKKTSESYHDGLQQRDKYDYVFVLIAMPELAYHHLLSAHGVGLDLSGTRKIEASGHIRGSRRS